MSAYGETLFFPVDLYFPCRLTRPTVISAKDDPKNDFKMYDAIPANQEALVQSLDPEMEKFLPMLQDSNLTHMQILQLLFFLA